MARRITAQIVMQTHGHRGILGFLANLRPTPRLTGNFGLSDATIVTSFGFVA